MDMYDELGSQAAVLAAVVDLVQYCRCSSVPEPPSISV
jgi:hypothetical protein